MKIIKDDEQRRRFGALRQLIMYMLRYKLIFACVVVVVIASNLLALVIPQLTGVIVDALVPGNVDFDVVVSNVINIALIGLASYVLSVLQNVLMLRAAQHVVVDLRHDVFQKLSRLPVRLFRWQYQRQHTCHTRIRYRQHIRYCIVGRNNAADRHGDSRWRDYNDAAHISPCLRLYSRLRCL